MMKSTILWSVMMMGMLWTATAHAQLFSSDSPFADPFAAPPGPALEVGQIIHINIVETNSAEEKTQTNNDKKSSLTWNLSNFFGDKMGRFFFGTRPGGTAIDYPNMGFQGQDKFDGKGESKLTGRVQARMSGVVKRILPSGNALIEARRTIVVGNDRKNILLTGIIRAEDVDDNNTISSDKVAEAQITYHGEGPVLNKAYPGLVNRFLDYVPLF